MVGWFKIKTAAKYADVSERTLRSWLKAGLRHSRLKTGTILIFREWLDEYLISFACQDTEVEKIAEAVCKELL